MANDTVGPEKKGSFGHKLASGMLDKTGENNQNFPRK
tara:strand:- start:342 stop:452 length:111 start_codon:yes stop_codon:yes gene_type:complete